MLMAGCGGPGADKASTGGGNQAGGAATAPGKFTLAWSEYPSWSVFGVADEQGLIDAAAGKMGSIEKKWNIDIELKQADYDTCISLYGSSQADAVCITNIDILGLAEQRPGVGVLPTSTSVGGDACLAVGIDDINQLEGKVTRGLERSVSQYAFERILTMKGKDPSKFPFQNMDPAAAAQAMQVGDASVTSIMVWNPFVLDTQRSQKKSKLLFDSSSIPEEIIDMVVVAKDAMARPQSDKFVSAVYETFYEINRRMVDPKTSEATLVAIGKKFSSLGLEDMKLVVQQTRFYKNKEEAIALLENEKFRKETMPNVAKFCVEHKIVEKAPTIGFDQEDSQFNLTSKWLREFQPAK